MIIDGNCIVSGWNYDYIMINLDYRQIADVTAIRQLEPEKCSRLVREIRNNSGPEVYGEVTNGLCTPPSSLRSRATGRTMLCDHLLLMTWIRHR